MHNELYEYVVLETRTEADGVTTVSVTLEDGTVPEFVAGQYINVYFPDSNSPEGKAYSISSAPHEEVLELTVRDIGEFSHKIATLEVGDVISGSLPYGFFYPENTESDLALIAGGIGVTPFRSMLRHALLHTPHRNIYLFHSVRSMSDAVFHKEFLKLKDELSTFSHMHFSTRETVDESDAVQNGRITPLIILKQLPSKENTEFLICGSISFTGAMWKGLRNAGVSENNLYTEAFFTHS